MARPSVGASRQNAGSRPIIDALIAGALAGGLAGLVEAVMMQANGFGAKNSSSAVIFAVASAEISLPIGALLGVGIHWLRKVMPTGMFRGIDTRLLACWIYGLGAAVPFLAATYFRLFLYLIANFRNLTLAALASTFLSIAATVSAIGCAGFVSGMAQRWARGRWVRPGTALLAVVVLWVVISAPGFLAGPDHALDGPFGFIGLLRKDSLDYSTPIALMVLGSVFPLQRWISGIGFAAKAIVIATMVVCTVAGASTAASDQARQPILEHGLISRASLRAMQRVGDRDGDGYSRWLGGGDCDDHNRDRHPGAREIRGNGIDEDCDGEDLPALPAVRTASHVEPVRPPRPTLPAQLSFLVLTVDALRPDLGYAGYRRPVSPNIDTLAQSSVIYDHVYSISTYTGFSLPPMMASRYPSEMPRSDRHEVQYGSENVLLAERLRAAGYRTAGAASHFLFNTELGWVDGFDRFVRTQPEGDAPPGSHIDLYHSSRGLADALIKQLADPTITSGPFFIWCHFLDPHKQYLEHPGFTSFGHAQRDLYDGEVAFTDHHIGRVLRALAGSPLADRTVVILTGDHGEAFGEHGEFFHGREVWDEVVRVPLLIHVPGAKPHKVTRTVSAVDFAPTVLDLAGLPEDPGARGQSLVTELFGGQLPDRPVLVDQPKNPYYPPKRAFIDGPYKLHHAIDSNAFRLFDLVHDPGETENLAASQPELLRKIRRSYSAFTSDIIELRPIASPSSASSEQP